MKMIQELEDRVNALEAKLRESNYNTNRLVQSAMKQSWRAPLQSQALYAMRLCLCVDTKDPLGEGRVRFFNPAMHERNTPVEGLPWAKPVSSMGGFDDCGAFWVPPAGSAVAIVFENGDRNSPYYLGSIWTRTKGKPGGGYWGRPVPEYQKYHQGTRTGYLVGRDDDTQNLPQWNTETYNNFDFDTEIDFENDPEAKKRITIANTYGLKTPQKHRLKMVDGNYDCNFRFKRVELVSGDGNGLIFKDDHLHPFGQWANPKCGGGGGADLSGCTDQDGNPLEKPKCVYDPSTQPTAANKYYKRKEECVMVNGPGTPQNNKIKLAQSGFALFSRSGNVFIADDSVIEPTGKPGWTRATEPFNYGCQNIFKGKVYMQSAHGHLFEMSDDEVEPEIRSNENRIRLKTPTGISLELNDHTLSGGIAGDSRGFKVETSSNHLLQMSDKGNDQAVAARREGGQPTPKAKDAFILLRSGYGLQFMMADYHNQEKTSEQYIEILSPQKDNPDGPHILRMQESTGSGSIVFLRTGGVFLGITVKDHIEVVGEEQKDDVMKLTVVYGTTVIDSKKVYYNASETCVIASKTVIILAAGEDCVDDDGNVGPCIYPVIVARKPKVCPFTGYIHFAEDSISDRVFATRSDDN